MGFIAIVVIVFAVAVGVIFAVKTSGRSDDGPDGDSGGGWGHRGGQDGPVGSRDGGHEAETAAFTE